MTDALPRTSRLSEDEFSVGGVFSRTWSVYSRNFALFSLVTVIASLPSLLLFSPGRVSTPGTVGGFVVFFGGLLLSVILSTLSQAIVLYGAFQDMRGRPVNLAESAAIGLRRFFPLVGLAIVFYFAVTFASILLVFPGLMLFTMWYIATPPCVVEQTGPLRSLGRSRELTKGHRWKIFGIVLLMVLLGLIGGGLVLAVTSVAGAVLALLVNLVWSALLQAFNAVLAVVIYRDLRVAKEGVDTDHIASVFD